jgi:hypothetical protein
MKFEKRIDFKQGTYIVATDRSFEDILIKEPLKLKSGSISVGEKTNLHGYFNTEIEYMGMLDNCAIFFLGEGDHNLFSNGGFYYDATFIISDDRIGKKYNDHSYRDVLLMNKNGKYYWK